jgi:hypothetical protein
MLFSFLLATGLIALSVTQTGATVQRRSTVPDELWSPLVAQKVYRTAANVSSTRYPQLTDRVQGKWVTYDVNYWTSGFLPVELYALRRREELCPSVSSGVDWLKLGRQWSYGLLSLIHHNGVGHDVGFISFPFVEELVMYVFVFAYSHS